MPNLKDIEKELSVEEINICFMALIKFSDGPICGPRAAMYYYKLDYTIKILEKSFKYVAIPSKTKIKNLILKLKKLIALALV